MKKHRMNLSNSIEVIEKRVTSIEKVNLNSARQK